LYFVKLKLQLKNIFFVTIIANFTLLLQNQILKKTQYIQFKALLLLLIYLLSNSPSVLFHHHKLEVASYEKATPCEKKIYYSDKDNSCNHKTHISKVPEKCSLCDNHTIAPHSFQTFLTEYFSKEIIADYLQVSENYYFQVPSTFSNRGPPSVLSLTV